jgi:hypothetical protein
MPGTLKWFPSFRPPDQYVVWLYSFLDTDIKLFCVVQRKPIRNLAMKDVKSLIQIWIHNVILCLLPRFRDVWILFTAISYTKWSKVIKTDGVFFFFRKFLFILQYYRTACFILRVHTDSAAVNFWRCQSSLKDTWVYPSSVATKHSSDE